ncbi:MAG TPA: FCD domain-containing protein [Terriglobia bacterium]|nr:FCD domain-containing protein [Terriglobia bacterium]
MSRRDDATAKLRRLLDSNHFPAQSRLPAERQLCLDLGISRSALREGLEILEAEGRIWRHIGKGTFVGGKPARERNGLAVAAIDTNPIEVLDTRLIIEPALARLAALHATEADIDNMRYLIDKSEAARDAETWELWDGTLHRAIAQATHNNMLISIFDAFNAIRSQENWRRLRETSQTPDRLHIYRAHHREVVEAIGNRDVDQAEDMMRRHIDAVRNNMLAKLAPFTPRAAQAVDNDEPESGARARDDAKGGNVAGAGRPE